MKLTEQQYNHYINNTNIPDSIKKELSNNVHIEKWTFVGT